jgi:hypothetical protein
MSGHVLIPETLQYGATQMRRPNHPSGTVVARILMPAGCAPKSSERQ